MNGQQKAAGPWLGEAASNTHYIPNRSWSIPHCQPRRLRLPAYGAKLAAAQRRGMNVPWLCIAVDDWSLGVSCPRIVVDHVPVGELDLRIVRGLATLVAHRAEPSRAIAVAELALRCGAVCAPIIDLATSRVTSTSEVLAARGLMGVST